LEVVNTYNQGVIRWCYTYIGPARLRLNLPELAPELKRVRQPWFKLTAKGRNDLPVLRKS